MKKKTQKGVEMKTVNKKALEFFDSVSGSLYIKLTEEPVEISPNLYNRRAPSTAEISEIKLEAHIYKGDNYEGDDCFRELTEKELNKTVMRQSTIRMQGRAGIVEHKAPDGKKFTVGDLLDAVEETERQTRGDTEWFDGIDMHHTNYEGISLEEDKDGEYWSIFWGS